MIALNCLFVVFTIHKFNECFYEENPEYLKNIKNKMNTKFPRRKRLAKAYLTIGKTFGKWISPLFTGLLLTLLRGIVSIGLLLDKLIFPSLRKMKITNPVVIVGNPRSGTTFLHRFLVSNNIGTGAQLWQLLYPSIILQKLIRPILPLLNLVSPTRHHSTEAHKTSLTSVETDDPSILFKHFDGFFLYGFILAWAEEDLFNYFDPRIRDTSQRDFDWLESVWIRVLKSSDQDIIIPKLFSISTNIPKFLSRFPDARLLYMVRDPLNVIPSGLSLVTGVLDTKFGFWNLPQKTRDRYIQRLYRALVELLIRFHDDWINGKIDRSKVMIVHYEQMMQNFDGLMADILKFIDLHPSEELIHEIKLTTEKQRNYSSKHQYDLKKFGLSAKQIKSDCSMIYETFLNNPKFD